MAIFSSANVRAGSAVGWRNCKPLGGLRDVRAERGAGAAAARGRAGSQAARPRERSGEAAAGRGAALAPRPASGERRRPQQRTLNVSEADVRLAQRLQEEERRERLAEEHADLEVARRMQEEEEQRREAEADQEDADASLAQLLAAEQRGQAEAARGDGALARSLQREHGRAGRLLARASELESFLEAPLGAAPRPRSGDLHPDTLRRLVTLSLERRRDHLPAPVTTLTEPCGDRLEASPAMSQQTSPPARPLGSLCKRSRISMTGATIAVGCSGL